MESPHSGAPQNGGASSTDLTRQRRAENLLQELAQKSWSDDSMAFLLGNLLKESPLLVGIAQLNETTFRHEFANEAARSFFGLTDSEGALSVALDSLEAQQLALSHRICTITDAPVSFKYAHNSAAEQEWLDVSMSALASDEDGAPKFLYVGCPTKPPAEGGRSSGEAESLFAGLVETTYTGLILHDRRVIACNSSISDLFGYDEDELVGMNALELIAEHCRRPVLENLRSGPAQPFETVGRRKDESTVFIEMVSRPYRFKGKDALVTGIRNITSRIKMEEYLIHSVTHDDLTGIPNRGMFLNRLWSAVTKKTETPSGRAAVLYMDVDRFKAINDELGHVVGDQVLIKVAKRLHRCVRDQDIVARLGGDEFAALLLDVSGHDEALAVAERIREHLCRPYAVEGNELNVRVSVGIVMCDDAHRQPDDIIHDADRAMYQAKSRGSAEAVMFEPSMKENRASNPHLEGEIREALKRDQFVVHYQPLAAADDGRLVGVEALVRWNHPERDVVPPDQFIPVAEDSGLIIEIDRSVLRKAAAQFKRWMDADAGSFEFLSVNVSPTQLRRADFAKQVGRILAEVDCPPEKIVLEITERTFLAKSDFEADLTRLSSMQVRVCVDDFATGYSSINLLSRLPFDMMKLDKAFTQRVGVSDRDVEVASNFVRLAHDLGMTVVAEGVETAKQLEQMRRLGCDYIQGFLLSPALDASGVDRLLSDQPPWLRFWTGSRALEKVD